MNRSFLDDVSKFRKTSRFEGQWAESASLIPLAQDASRWAVEIYILGNAWQLFSTKESQVPIAPGLSDPKMGTALMTVAEKPLGSEVSWRKVVASRPANRKKRGDFQAVLAKIGNGLENHIIEFYQGQRQALSVLTMATLNTSRTFLRRWAHCCLDQKQASLTLTDQFVKQDALTYDRSHHGRCFEIWWLSWGRSSRA